MRLLAAHSLLLALLVQATVAARVINITHLFNCEDTAFDAPVHLTEITYELDADKLCDTVHGKFDVKSVDTMPKELLMVLYMCEGGSIEEPCLQNPTEHSETIDCERFVTDDSGPWHMFAVGMKGTKCAEEVGSFELFYSRLKLDHLIKYLDIHDDQYTRFRLRMYFGSQQTGMARGCANVDFNLV